jgi:FMN phosphatase YigB (HAD superfamily)
MVKTVFFDVGGTLLHPDLDRLLAPLLTRVNPSPAQLAAADRAAKYSIPATSAGGTSAAACAVVSSPGNSGPVATGPGDHEDTTNNGHWRVFFVHLLAALGGCDDLLPELVARAADSSYWTVLAAAAPETLAQLRRRYRLAVISNADGGIRRLLDRAGIADFFEQVIDSGLVGCEKPDPRIFQTALSAMGAEAVTSVYVGDIYGIDYCGAAGVGMQAVLMDPAGVYAGWPAPSLRSLAELPAWLGSRGA